MHADVSHVFHAPQAVVRAAMSKLQPPAKPPVLPRTFEPTDVMARVPSSDDGTADAATFTKPAPVKPENRPTGYKRLAG